MVDITYLLQSGEVNHSTTLVNTCFSIHIVSHRNQILKKKYILCQYSEKRFKIINKLLMHNFVSSSAQR